MSPQKLPDRIVSCFSVTAEQDGGCGYRVHLQSRSYFLRKRDWLMPDRCFQRWPARQSLLLRLPQFTCWCVLRIVILAVNFILYSAIVSQRTPWQLSMWTQLLFDLLERFVKAGLETFPGDYSIVFPHLKAIEVTKNLQTDNQPDWWKYYLYVSFLTIKWLLIGLQRHIIVK